MSATAPTNPGQLPQRAALASICAALFLLVLKAVATWQTGSVSMLGSLADSGLDLLASATLLVGLRIAAMPPDSNHRFGHGKAEALAALFQVTLISVSAIGIGWQAIRRLGEDAATRSAETGIGVSVIAIAVTFALLAYQRHVLRLTGSVGVRTDHVHYQSDLWLNLSVIAALALDQFAGLAWADPVFGLAIALWLAWSAWGAASQAVDELMDHEWPEEKRLAFVEVAARHPELVNLHDLRTRTSGTRDFVQFHVAMNPDMTVREAHDVVECVERSLEQAFPDTEILIHIDPEGQIDEPGNPLAERDELSKVEEGKQNG